MRIASDIGDSSSPSVCRFLELPGKDLSGGSLDRRTREEDCRRLGLSGGDARGDTRGDATALAMSAGFCVTTICGNAANVPRGSAPSESKRMCTRARVHVRARVVGRCKLISDRQHMHTHARALGMCRYV
jgi:hypothetical protein